EDLLAPYTYSLDSTLYSIGSHTITAVARDAAGNTTTSAGISVTVNNPLDVTPPVISVVAGSVITSNSANISWTTTEMSDSQVEYGLTVSYGNSTAINSSLVTAHSQSLNGLSQNALYHYRVKSKDAAGN